MSDVTVMAQRIKTIRIAKMATQRGLEKACQIPKGWVNRFENGHVPKPPPLYIEAIIKRLGIAYSDLTNEKPVDVHKMLEHATSQSKIEQAELMLAQCRSALVEFNTTLLQLSAQINATTQLQNRCNELLVQLRKEG